MDIYKYVVSFRSTTDPVNTWNRAVPWNFQQCGMCDQQSSDQQAHMNSLVRAFASCLNILRLLSYWSNITRTACYTVRLIWVYSCQNATLSEISCCSSYIDVSMLGRSPCAESGILFRGCGGGPGPTARKQSGQRWFFCLFFYSP